MVSVYHDDLSVPSRAEAVGDSQQQLQRAVNVAAQTDRKDVHGALVLIDSVYEAVRAEVG